MNSTKDERVYVEAPLFSGRGTITNTYPGEQFPIEVVLEDGDSDGHKIKRVKADEITRREGDE
jgi:hypothetical protein